MATQHDRNERIQRGGEADSGSVYRPADENPNTEHAPTADKVVGGGRNDLDDGTPRSDRAAVDRLVRGS